MKGRTLEQLRSQYVSNVKKTDKAIRAVPGMRGPGPHGRGAVSGKMCIRDSLTACGRAEAVRLQKVIHSLDPLAFVVIATSSEIIGSGFRQV